MSLQKENALYIIHNCDAMRSLDNIDKPDERGVLLLCRQSLEQWKQCIEEQIVPDPCIPQDVRIQIETVKNLFLYSWFVYRFGMVAKNQILNATEFALKEKYKKEGIEKSPNGLSNKLKDALRREWFSVRSFSCDSPLSKSEGFPLNLVNFISESRNDLNHGSSSLLPPTHLLYPTRLCVELINALFQGKRGKSFS